MNKEGAITAYQCKKCGKLHYPFHDRCLACKGREFDEVKPAGNAKLITYTAISNLQRDFEQHCLIIGVAEFENKVKAMGQIKVDSVNQLEMGMTLKPTWEPIRVQCGEDVFGLKFEPMKVEICAS